MENEEMIGEIGQSIDSLIVKYANNDDYLRGLELRLEKELTEEEREITSAKEEKKRLTEKLSRLIDELTGETEKMKSLLVKVRQARKRLKN